MVEYVGKREDADDIITCTEMILSTVQGTMPYMRDMGIPSEVIGKNISESEDMYTMEAIDQIETWEDRAAVDEIQIQKSDGAIGAKVVLKDVE